MSLQEAYIEELRDKIEELENLIASGVHTCSVTCKRPLCVLRRENKELVEAREEASADYADLLNDHRELQAKVEELEEKLDSLTQPQQWGKVWQKYCELESIDPENASGIAEIGGSFIYTAGFAEGMQTGGANQAKVEELTCRIDVYKQYETPNESLESSMRENDELEAKVEELEGAAREVVDWIEEIAQVKKTLPIPVRKLKSLLPETGGEKDG